MRIEETMTQEVYISDSSDKFKIGAKVVNGAVVSAKMGYCDGEYYRTGQDGLFFADSKELSDAIFLLNELRKALEKYEWR